MATTKKLEKVTGIISARKASGALGANLLVTLDLSADADGGSVKQISALAHKPFGVCEVAWADTLMAGVVESGIMPIVCVDSSIAAGVAVYNDATGKVTSTAGAGATLVGTTRSTTTGANQLVSVKLAI